MLKTHNFKVSTDRYAKSLVWQHSHWVTISVLKRQILLLSTLRAIFCEKNRNRLNNDEFCHVYGVLSRLRLTVGRRSFCWSLLLLACRMFLGSVIWKKRFKKIIRQEFFATSTNNSTTFVRKDYSPLKYTCVGVFLVVGVIIGVGGRRETVSAFSETGRTATKNQMKHINGGAPETTSHFPQR